MIHCFYCSDNNEIEENNNGMEYLHRFVNIYPIELLPNTITMKLRKITMEWRNNNNEMEYLHSLSIFTLSNYYQTRKTMKLRKITMKWSICSASMKWSIYPVLSIFTLTLLSSYSTNPFWRKDQISIFTQLDQYYSKRPLASSLPSLDQYYSKRPLASLLPNSIQPTTLSKSAVVLFASYRHPVCAPNWRTWRTHIELAHKSGAQRIKFPLNHQKGRGRSRVLKFHSPLVLT